MNTGLDRPAGIPGPVAAGGALLLSLHLLHPLGYWTPVLIVAATAAVGAAVRTRGRFDCADAGLIFAWLHPGWPGAVHRGEGLRLAAWTVAASLAALALVRLCGRRPAAPRPRGWGWPVFAALLALWSLQFPSGPDGSDVDASWKRSLVYFHEHGLQAGVDWVFTMGPLGWLHRGTYAPGAFGAMVAWTLGLSAAAAFILTELLRGIPDRRSRGVAGALALLLLPLDPDGAALLGTVGVALLLLRDPEAEAGGLILGALFLALIAWTKFNLGVVAAGAAVFVAAVRWRSSGVPFALLSFSALLAAWTAAGQRFSGLPSYVANSLAITASYSEAMPQSSTGSELMPGLAALLVGVTALALSGAARPADARRRAAALAGLLALFVAWKAGFVREDPYHTPIFFSVATLLPWLLPEPPAADPRGPRAFRRLRLATVVPFVLWVFLSRTVWPFPYTRDFAARPIRNGLTLLGLGRRTEDHERKAREVARACALPAVRAAVGASSIDVLGTDQEILILNDLPWAPRPVFQSYAAYSEPLARMNARFFEGDHAPEFVLYRPNSIDRRVPMAEDGLALRTLLRRYRPEMLENSFLLLRRRPGAPEEPAERVLLERDLGWDESADLGPAGGTPRTLSLDLRPTAAGRLVNVLFRTPPVFVELVDSRGASSTWRLVPSTARLGFRIDPLLLTAEDAGGWFRGEPGRRLRSVKVVGSPAARIFFSDRIGLRLSETR